MIKKVDTMFPRCIFLAKNTNYKELSDRFDFYCPTTEQLLKYTEEAFNNECFDESIVATVFLVGDKKAKICGYLVILNERKVDLGTCAHEATHICKHMEDYFMLESSANEYRAYMTEWYTNQIYKFWKE